MRGTSQGGHILSRFRVFAFFFRVFCVFLVKKCVFWNLSWLKKNARKLVGWTIWSDLGQFWYPGSTPPGTGTKFFFESRKALFHRISAFLALFCAFCAFLRFFSRPAQRFFPPADGNYNNEDYSSFTIHFILLTN